MASFQRADVLLGKCGSEPSVLEAVNFHGVSKTKHDALVKEVSELYNSRNLDELVRNSFLAAKHMQEVGLFDGCTALIDTSKRGPKSYVVNFVAKEPTAMTLGAKVGMTTSGDADACLTGGKQSFDGRGESVDLSYSKTIRGGHSFNVSAAKPVLGWQKYSNYGGSVFRNFETLRWNKAEVTENGIVLRYNGQLFGKLIRHSLNVNNLWRTFHPRSGCPFKVREHAGHSTKFSIENTVGIDTRDRAILASKGYLAKFTQEHAGLIGDASFIRYQVDLQASAPLFLGSFLSASLLANVVHPTAGKTLHLLDRAYLGGPHDLRGFDLRSLGPREKGASLGGSAAFAVAAHIYRPLVPADMLFLHGFVTAGTVSSLQSRSWVSDVLETPRVSAGVGVSFIFKNLIRFELNYVVPIRSAASDATVSGVQFGAGLNFL
uniref:Omp85 domain-containing protein n=1 Tax=Panagrellus redivivus TaxID=6233 RepID=A0A7E4VIZ1_PANRE